MHAMHVSKCMKRKRKRNYEPQIFQYLGTQNIKKHKLKSAKHGINHKIQNLTFNYFPLRHFLSIQTLPVRGKSEKASLNTQFGYLQAQELSNAAEEIARENS